VVTEICALWYNGVFGVWQTSFGQTVRSLLFAQQKEISGLCNILHCVHNGQAKLVIETMNVRYDFSKFILKHPGIHSSLRHYHSTAAYTHQH